RFPISFVIKSTETVEVLRQKLEAGARKQFGIEKIVKNYMVCLEEIINIPVLQERFTAAVQKGYLSAILDEIVKQSKVEFNYSEEIEDDEEARPPEIE
ncbi:MAG TPA: type II restriction endonuclease, partial [Verrucomicrobiae bacterium]|nr:type II restriction endonuclease [Verrucomicrobiae bacterium]